jgi:hypothetical protein
VNPLRALAATIIALAVLAGCDSASPVITGHPDTDIGITASLALSGALEGTVTVDNDGSSLDSGRMGCTQPDISGEVPFGILFLGHLAGQAAGSLEVSITQTQSAANSADPNISVTFPDPTHATTVDLQQGGIDWGSATSGTVSMHLDGTTETGTVDAQITGGATVPGPVTTVHLSGTWSCTITT